jgi:hypothetical protein
MDFDRLFVPDDQQAVAVKVFGEIIVNGVLIEIFSVDEQLGIVTVGNIHDKNPFYSVKKLRRNRQSSEIQGIFSPPAAGKISVL